MSNGQQTKADSARPTRSGGVLVNFPAPQNLPPAVRTADVPAVTSLQDSICQEFPVSCSGEAQWDDQSLSTPSGITGSELITAQHSVQSNEESSENSDPVFLQQNRTAPDVHPESRQVNESIVPPVAPIQPKRNWLERWLFPDSAGQDKRSGARKPAPGLVAHFWTGGPPKSQNVRDISATGMFVVTEERWYPGTQILITLTKTLQDGPPAERSITVLATAVRWGDDGVGLEFACNAPRKTRQKEPVISDGADGEQLGQFVEQFGAMNDTGPKSRGKRKR